MGTIDQNRRRGLKAMNIFMIYPCQGNMATFNYGLASITAVLKQAGHNVKLLMVDNCVKDKDIVKEIASFNTDIIGFSCMSNYWQYVKNLSRKIKSDTRLKNVLIFAGGPHAIVCPLSVRESEDIEGICIGEGEHAFLEVIDKIQRGVDFRNTFNFYFNGKKGIIKNEMRTLIKDLDDLPFPDRDVFPNKVFSSYANFTFSRGCPFSCSYCCNSAFHNIFKGKGKSIRYRSVPKVLEELQAFLKKYTPEVLSFDDDCFNKNLKWFKEFCPEYKEKINLPYTCNTRPELLNTETARLLKESGCRKINIGVESGDEHLRRTVLNRNISDEQIIKAFDLAKENGMQAMSFNMIGFPGETRDSVRKTVELNKKIKPTYAQISMFYPYAGTPLGELCKEKGYIENKNSVFNFFNGSSILKLPNLSRRDIKELFFRFELEVNNSDNFMKSYIVKRVKVTLFSIYNSLPYFLKNMARSIKRCIKTK